MNWNALSIAVVTVFVLQLVALTLVVLAGLKVKSGAVGWVRNTLLPLVAGGKRVVAIVSTLTTGLLEQVQNLQRQSRAIQRHFQLAPPPAGMWIHPRNLRQALQFGASLRARALQPKSPAKPSKTLRLAERLGLVPPILRKLAPLGKAAQTALKTAKHLRR